jgi:hypothetical protein
MKGSDWTSVQELVSALMVVVLQGLEFSILVFWAAYFGIRFERILNFAVLISVVDNKGFWFHKDTR